MQKEEIWWRYLSIHGTPPSRLIPYIATTILIFCCILSLITASGWGLLPGIGLWLALIWISHLLNENAHQLFCAHPIGCLICSFRMSFSALTGHLQEEIATARHIRHDA